MATIAREDHPVWTVYDRLRSARLSAKYYGCRLAHVERVSLCIDVVLLISAPSSALAGFGYWKELMGPEAWQAFGAIAALVSLVKPLLHLPRRIKAYEMLLTGYRMLEYDLMEIKLSIEQKGRFDATAQADLRKALRRERSLVGSDPDPRESQRVRRKCEEEVLQELPAERFFVPQE